MQPLKLLENYKPHMAKLNQFGIAYSSINVLFLLLIFSIHIANM